MKHASLGEIAIKLGINKSQLAYYYRLGLIKPIVKVGRMNIFDADETLKILKNIKTFKKEGKTLEEMK
jgi:DNA-binding transcriptional MerR regulator